MSRENTKIGSATPFWFCPWCRTWTNHRKCKSTAVPVEEEK